MNLHQPSYLFFTDFFPTSTNNRIKYTFCPLLIHYTALQHILSFSMHRENIRLRLRNVKPICTRISNANKGQKSLEYRKGADCQRFYPFSTQGFLFIFRLLLYEVSTVLSGLSYADLLTGTDVRTLDAVELTQLLHGCMVTACDFAQSITTTDSCGLGT